jgi:hypothetical protein
MMAPPNLNAQLSAMAAGQPVASLPPARAPGSASPTGTLQMPSSPMNYAAAAPPVGARLPPGAVPMGGGGAGRPNAGPPGAAARLHLPSAPPPASSLPPASSPPPAVQPRSGGPASAVPAALVRQRSSSSAGATGPPVGAAAMPSSGLRTISGGGGGGGGGASGAEAPVRVSADTIKTYGAPPPFDKAWLQYAPAENEVNPAAVPLPMRPPPAAATAAQAAAPQPEVRRSSTGTATLAPAAAAAPAVVRSPVGPKRIDVVAKITAIGFLASQGVDAGMTVGAFRERVLSALPDLPQLKGEYSVHVRDEKAPPAGDGQVLADLVAAGDSVFLKKLGAPLPVAERVGSTRLPVAGRAGSPAAPGAAKLPPAVAKKPADDDMWAELDAQQASDDLKLDPLSDDEEAKPVDDFDLSALDFDVDKMLEDAGLDSALSDLDAITGGAFDWNAPDEKPDDAALPSDALAAVPLPPMPTFANLPPLPQAPAGGTMALPPAFRGGALPPPVAKAGGGLPPPGRGSHAVASPPVPRRAVSNTDLLSASPPVAPKAANSGAPASRLPPAQSVASPDVPKRAGAGAQKLPPAANLPPPASVPPPAAQRAPAFAMPPPPPVDAFAIPDMYQEDDGDAAPPPPPPVPPGAFAIDFDEFGRPTSLPPDTFEWCMAAFDYEAQSHSELGFAAGAWIALTEKDSDGWWRGFSLAALENGEPSRYFPSSFIDAESCFVP